MARKRKQKDLEESIDESKQTERHKNSELTADERHALHLRHCLEYEVALAAKKKADAEIKNVGKRIKAEDDSVAKVKKTLRARTPEGEAELSAEIAETAEVLRWAGVSVGETADLFPTDRMPAEDRAFAEGKRAGLAGEPCKPPYDPSVPQYQRWMDGWRSGQEALMSAFAKKAGEESGDDNPTMAEPPPPTATEGEAATAR